MESYSCSFVALLRQANKRLLVAIELFLSKLKRIAHTFVNSRQTTKVGNNLNTNSRNSITTKTNLLKQLLGCKEMRRRKMCQHQIASCSNNKSFWIHPNVTLLLGRCWITVLELKRAIYLWSKYIPDCQSVGSNKMLEFRVYPISEQPDVPNEEQQNARAFGHWQ